MLLQVSIVTKRSSKRVFKRFTKRSYEDDYIGDLALLNICNEIFED